MKTLELRPERALLKSNFDGYKLSLEPIPILRSELTNDQQPDHVHPAEHQYSCLHAQLFGLQNHLVRDPWAAGNCYYVDRSWIVRRVQYSEGSGRLVPPSSVFKIAKGRTRVDGDYHCSLVFLSEKFALVADGQGGLRLVDTGDRVKGDEWKGKFVLPEVEEMGTGGFIILDGRFEIINGERQVHAVCARVEQKESIFDTVLYWLKLVQADAGQEWKYHSVRVLNGRGFPNYCALEPKSGGLIVSSDKLFEFVLDTENPILPKEEKREEHMEVDAATDKTLFSWTQSDEDITIKITKEEGIDYKVSNDNKKLTVKAGEKVIIDGDNLFAGIDPDMTSWTCEAKDIQITLFKAQQGIMWPCLFPGSPEEEGDRAADEEMPPVSNLTTQLEECDFGTAGEETEYTVARMDAVSHETTHKIFLGSNAPLFKITLRPGFPAALALRYDVDAILWLQHPGAEWSLRHEGTLHAFGYVQASKQQRKFMSCSPDMNYALICEAQRHVFIYKGSYNTAGGLRNRSGPQVSIGQQKLISLEGSGEILGICCENDYSILLTESQILVLQLCIEE